MCDSNEGCTGAGYMAQVMGSHNVLEVYEDMVTATADNSNEVIASILGNETGRHLTPSKEVWGQTLMDQNPITVVVYNSLASKRTEMMSIQVPICNVGIVDAKGARVVSQVTAQTTINDGVSPFFDFDLHFEVPLAPLSYTSFTVTPLDSTRHCGGNLADSKLASFSEHRPMWPPASAHKPARGVADALMNSLILEQQRMMGLGATAGEQAGLLPANHAAAKKVKAASGPQTADLVALENKFLKVYIDTALGIQAILDKGTGTNYSFTHELFEYQSKKISMLAYDFQPTAMATPVLNGSQLLAASVSLGPVMQEARFQVSGEHKTRVRLWVSDDPAVGGRLEFGHRIGVLEQRTEIMSRFVVGGDKLAAASFYSEDNGYETVEHASGCPGCDTDPTSIPYRHFPSQMSTFLSDGAHQLSIALEHSHAVASLINGSIDVVQHRRGVAYPGVDGHLALDDSDRIFTQTWVSLGNVSTSNRLRHSNKLRLNHPIVVLFGEKHKPAAAAAGARQTYAGPRVKEDRHQSSPSNSGVPPQVHVQNVRATDSSAQEVMVNLMHVYGKDELPAADSLPVLIDISALLKPFRPVAALEETTLNGVTALKDLDRLRWNSTKLSTKSHAEPVHSAVTVGSPQVSLSPFAFRTFLAK